MIKELTIARALPWLIAGALTLGVAAFSAGSVAGWVAHGKWTKAAQADAWKTRAHGLADDWRAANDDLLARLDERDAQVTSFNKGVGRINAALNDVLREIEHASKADSSPWGADRSMRLNRAFRNLEAATRPADGAEPGP